MSPRCGPFGSNSRPARVLFGDGRIAELADEVGRLGCRRALVLSTAGRQGLADLASKHLGPLAAGLFAGAVMHTPVETTESAMERVRATRADCIVAIGGGSTIGLGKAIALRTDLPQVAIPTTYAGSEMTDVLGETRDGAKTTQRTPKVLPETVIYDVTLTLDLPPLASATSGMNAIAHGVEALYAPDGNPVVSLMAEEGIRSLATSLPAIMAAPRNLEARAAVLIGAWLCGSCLGSVAMALHHKLCHVLGGGFRLPHAETHAVILPYSTAYNAAAAPRAMAAVARALDAVDAVRGLQELKHKLVGSLSLEQLGMPRDGLERAAEAACASPYPNPRNLEVSAIRALLMQAYDGAVPAVA